MWKGKETPKCCPSQILFFLSQLKEFHQQTGFAAFLGLAVMTAAVEGVPHLARRTSSLKTNHQLRRSCGLVGQAWQTTVEIFLNGEQHCLPRKMCGYFSFYFPLHPHLRKVFLVLLIGDRNDNCGSLWGKPWPAYSIAELLLTSERPRYSTEALKHAKGKALATHKWLNWYKIWDEPRIVEVEN